MKLTSGCILFLFGFLLLTSTVCIVMADEEEQNLVKNPEFIDLQQGWSLRVVSGAATWEVEKKGGVGDDTECAFIEITALPDPWWNIYLYQINIPLEKDKKYTYGVWAKTEAGESKDIALKVQKNADGTNYITKPFSIDDEWKEYWVTWTQKETQANNVIIVFANSANLIGKDRLWLDHFRVYEGDYEEDELSPEAVDSLGKLITVWGDMKVE